MIYFKKAYNNIRRQLPTVVLGQAKYIRASDINKSGFCVVLIRFMVEMVLLLAVLPPDRAREGESQRKCGSASKFSDLSIVLHISLYVLPKIPR